MLKYMLMLPLLAFNFPGSKDFVPTPGRNIEYVGPVNANMSMASQAVMAWAIADNTQPIDILISSFGGEILWGQQLINSIEFAKARGIDVRCVNLGNAQSMGFMIMMHCSHRFAVPSAIWMFHYPRQTIAELTTSDLEEMAKSLKEEEKRFVKDLMDGLHLTEAVVREDCKDETRWSNDELNKLSPGYTDTITTIQGVQIKPL